MIEEDFYCTLKLKTGEEIFAKVAASEENDRTMLIVSNPIVFSEIKNRSKTVGYKIGFVDLDTQKKCRNFEI